jgi:hypothetical protein
MVLWGELMMEALLILYRKNLKNRPVNFSDEEDGAKPLGLSAVDLVSTLISYYIRRLSEEKRETRSTANIRFIFV